MGKNIGYHTRQDSDNTIKVMGGSFGGSIDMETVNRLVRSHLTVTMKQSGRAVFVDKAGREVRLYLTVEPESTEAGKLVVQAWRREQAAREELALRQEEAEQAEVAQAMEGLTHAEILRRLKGSAAVGAN